MAVDFFFLPQYYFFTARIFSISVNSEINHLLAMK